MAQYDAWDATDREEWAAEPEKEDPDIQALLDIGYDQLDAFVSWLEESVGLDTRTAQQDCFNAEALIDYLANHQRKAAADIGEFDLRWFLFNYYIRKAQADDETEERLLDSLQRFYHYLAQKHRYTQPSWLQATLEEEPFYRARRTTYTELNAGDEREWEEGFQVWCEELETDLEARSLWLPRDLGDGMIWSDLMGWREATLQEEANRLWQDERQRLLESGLDFESVPARLLDSYYFWLSTPQDRLEGQTPREVILSERQDRDEGD